MTDLQYKHLASNSTFIRSVFHLRAYIQMRSLGLVLETLSLPGLRCIQARTVILPTRELTYWLISQEKWSHTTTNSNRWTRASTLPSLLFPFNMYFIYITLQGCIQSLALPQSLNIAALLIQVYHSPFPIPTTTEKKDAPVHRFMWYCLLPFYLKEGNRETQEHGFPSCCHSPLERNALKISILPVCPASCTHE